MLDRLNQQPPDALLALIKLYDADPRDNKIDLGVGVYRTADGATPVFGAIKAAEKRLVDEQDTKAYLGPEGDMGFVHALMPHVFGDASTTDGRIDGMQTPGGTGAVRLAVALAGKAGVEQIWMGTPSWPNHAQILADCGMEVATFNHANADGSADMDALRDVIAKAGEDDAVLLHGACHNPTGVDYTNERMGRDRRRCWPTRACCRSSTLPIRGWAMAWTTTPMACARCWPPCRRRWWPIAATRTSASTATAWARSM